VIFTGIFKYAYENKMLYIKGHTYRVTMYIFVFIIYVGSDPPSKKILVPPLDPVVILKATSKNVRVCSITHRKMSRQM
jgi:hypothetical protein